MGSTELLVTFNVMIASLLSSLLSFATNRNSSLPTYPALGVYVRRWAA